MGGSTPAGGGRERDNDFGANASGGKCVVAAKSYNRGDFTAYDNSNDCIIDDDNININNIIIINNNNDYYYYYCHHYVKRCDCDQCSG